MTARPLPSSLLLVSTSLVALAAACSSDPVTGSTGTGGHGGASTGSTSTTTSSTGDSGGGGALPLPAKFKIKGTITDGTAPLAGAIVMQAGTTPSFVTGADGAYEIEIDTTVPGVPAVMSAKVGYRSRGDEILELPQGPLDFALVYASPPDNTGYHYEEPGTGDFAHDNSTKYCGHCHTTMAKQFQSSVHASAARNPLLQDLYAGVSAAYATQAACAAAGGVFRSGLVPGSAGDAAAKCYLGGGVLPDLNPSCGAPGGAACDDPALAAAQKPTAFGRCADCHAPAIEGVAGGRSLHEATGIAFDDGAHCDFCHHVRDVDLTKPPGVGGALIVQRPHEHLDDNPAGKLMQVTFGPFPDVINGFVGASYQPRFSSSDYCGGCHEQRQEALLPGTSVDALRWPGGLPTHSTYSEWAESSFNAPATTCQSCHMPPDDTGLKSSIDVADESNFGVVFGYARTPAQLKQHTFREALDGSPRLIDDALTLSLAGAGAGGVLGVSAAIKNTKAGHAIPSGEPMRSLLLLVRAEACGAALHASGGMTLDDWGGALAEGTLGPDASVNGAALSWAGGALAAKVGQVVRAVRATGMYVDYPGVGFFGNPALSPMEKGLLVHAPVGEATIVSIVNGVLTLDQALPLQLGDQLYLGEAAAFPPADGSPLAAYAGSAGLSFARTLVDTLGHRGVPHYRAVDMLSDNRIGPGVAMVTAHDFALPPGCATAKVSAVLLYRKLPLALARERGWAAKDQVVAQASVDVALP
jgi:hypothetical protein